MKKIVLFLLLFAAAETGMHAQTINVINNTPFPVGLFISYSTIAGGCATNKTVMFTVPGISNTTYNVGALTWSGGTPATGGLFIAVDYSDDMWNVNSLPHNINSNPCGNSTRYDHGVVGDPNSCAWLTTNDCFVTDPGNANSFFPPNVLVNASFTPGVNAVVTFN